jgi:hypothetical protein
LLDRFGSLAEVMSAETDALAAVGLSLPAPVYRAALASTELRGVRLGIARSMFEQAPLS